jgi:hypothetical protein
MDISSVSQNVTASATASTSCRRLSRLTSSKLGPSKKGFVAFPVPPPPPPRTLRFPSNLKAFESLLEVAEGEKRRLEVNDLSLSMTADRDGRSKVEMVDWVRTDTGSICGGCMRCNGSDSETAVTVDKLFTLNWVARVFWGLLTETLPLSVGPFVERAGLSVQCRYLYGTQVLKAKSKAVSFAQCLGILVFHSKE